jgi:Arc/MetJ-type ribon-helix-helix transcriptional regulator
MVMTRSVQVRLTKSQYERLKGCAEMRGFSSMSSFLRYVALEQEYATHDKVREIHAHLIASEARKAPRRNAALGAR